MTESWYNVVGRKQYDTVKDNNKCNYNRNCIKVITQLTI